MESSRDSPHLEDDVLAGGRHDPRLLRRLRHRLLRVLGAPQELKQLPLGPLEEVRINALKLLTLILANTKPNKKKELMDESGLWALLTDRVSLHTPALTVQLYTTLFELLVETPHHLKTRSTRIVNPAVLKVIANTIRQGGENDELMMKLRILFLDDLIRLFQARVLHFAIFEKLVFMIPSRIP